MARIAPKPTRDDVAPDKRHLFDEIIARRGELSGPTVFFMNSPELAAIYSHLADYLRTGGKLTPGQVRLAGLMVAREFDCQYIWAVNQPQAATTGPSAAAVEAIANRSTLDNLTGDEAILARFIAELLRSRHVSQPAYAAAAKVLGSDQALLELTATISLYTMIANMVNAFEVEPPPNTPRLP